MLISIVEFLHFQTKRAKIKSNIIEIKLNGNIFSRASQLIFKNVETHTLKLQI